MFGNAAASKPATSGLFGASGTAQPQVGGLFGSNTTQTTIGGQSATNSATQPQTGTLFGQSQPATSGNLFGSSLATTSQPQTGGLNSSTQQPASNTGLFGTPAPTQPTTAGNLFSLKTTSQPQQSNGLFSVPQSSLVGGNLFGQNNTSQPQNGKSLFGNTAAQNKLPPSQQPALGTSLMGNNSNGGLFSNQTVNQQQNIVPGVLIDTSNIRGTTRYNDLKEELQKQIIEVDNMIQAQIQLKQECDAIMPAHDSQLAQIPIDVEFCQRKLIGVDSAADSDIQAISAVQKLIKSDAEAAKLSFKAIEILRLPPQYHTSGVWSPKSDESLGSGKTEDIVGFFSQCADELSVKLSTYQKHITEIEQHLRGIEANSAHQINSLVAKKNGNTTFEESSFDQLAGVLRDFETGLLKVAGKVGETRKCVTALQLNQLGPKNTSSRYGGRDSIY